MEKGGRVRTSAVISNGVRARRSGYCILLVFIVAGVLAFSFLKVGGLRSTLHKESKPLSLSQIRDKTETPADLPPVREIDDAAEDTFYASDLLSRIRKPEQAAPKPGEDGPGEASLGQSADAEFYASDALAEADRARKNQEVDV